MSAQIFSSEGGVITVVTFVNLLNNMCTFHMVVQGSWASTFMVTYFAAENHAFMSICFVLRKIWDSSSFEAAKIAWKSYALMDGLCVNFQMFTLICSVFAILTFIFPATLALYLSSSLFKLSFVLNVLLHHSPNPTFAILRHTFWKKKSIHRVLILNISETETKTKTSDITQTITAMV